MRQQGRRSGAGQEFAIAMPGWAGMCGAASVLARHAVDWTLVVCNSHHQANMYILPT